MLRDLIVNEGIASDATFAATAELKTGMAVVKDCSAGTAAVPSSETAAELCFVQKERYATGVNAARTQFSDYDTELNTVKNGDKMVLYAYPSGSVFATDQFDATTAVAANVKKVFSAGTNGKLGLATTSTVKSVYEFLGTYSDNGHTLAKFHVLDTAKAN